MKRVSLLLLLLLAVFPLPACTGGNGTQTTDPVKPTATPLSPTPTPLPENATTVARIRARGFLLVGIRYDLPPFGYVAEVGEVAGFGVDCGRELARRWLGDTQAVQFRQVRSDTAIEHLQAGNMDAFTFTLAHSGVMSTGHIDTMRFNHFRLIKFEKFIEKFLG